VSGVVREPERFLVQHFDETLRAATVLDIGRVGGGYGREERGIELGDEGRKLRRHAIGKARSDAFLVGARGPALGLCTPGRRREDNVAVVGHGTIRRAHEPASPSSQIGQQVGPGDSLAGLAPQHNMDHFLFDDNIPLSEDIIAAYATIWTVSIALQPLWKSLSAAVSPRPRAGSRARRPPLPARWASSKRGSGYALSTAPRARSASPRPAIGFWPGRAACSPISRRSNARRRARAWSRGANCASPRRSCSDVYTCCRS